MRRLKPVLRGPVHIATYDEGCTRLVGNLPSAGLPARRDAYAAAVLRLHWHIAEYLRLGLDQPAATVHLPRLLWWNDDVSLCDVVERRSLVDVEVLDPNLLKCEFLPQIVDCA